MKNPGTKIDDIIQSYRANIISRKMAVTQLSPLVEYLNRAQVRRHRAKVFNIERMLG